MSGLSVFDSFAFGLYFLGHSIRPNAFPEVAKPRNITCKTTSKAFSAAFSQAAITGLLVSLPQDSRFSAIDTVRNLLAHRTSGRPSVCVSSTMRADGTLKEDWREETWHLLGANGELMKLTFDQELLQRHLDNITGLLSSLALAAREFAEANQPPRAAP
jgi:hypothetical protein